MPRGKRTTKALSQRTFKLPANILSAFDALTAHFDEDPDRVARRLIEDGVRKIARDHSIESVLNLLGERKENPFDALAQQEQPPYFPLPLTEQSQSRAFSDLGDVMLPAGVGASLPREAPE